MNRKLLDTELSNLINDGDIRLQRIGMELSKLLYSAFGRTGDPDGDIDAFMNIIEEVRTMRQDVNRAAIARVEALKIGEPAHDVILTSAIRVITGENKYDKCATPECPMNREFGDILCHSHRAAVDLGFMQLPSR